MNKRSEWFRRHPWTGGLILALAVAALVESVVLWKLRVARENSERAAERLKQAADIAQEYRWLKERLVSEAPRLAPGARLTPDRVTQVAEQRGIAGKITETRANPTRRDSRTQEQVIYVTLIGVVEGELLGLLSEIEKMDGAVKVKQLRVSPTPNQAGLVDAHVQIAAFETTGPGG